MRRQAQPPRSRGCDRYSTKRGGVDPTGSAAQPPREGCVHQGDAMSRPRPSPPPPQQAATHHPPAPVPPSSPPRTPTRLQLAKKKNTGRRGVGRPARAGRGGWIGWGTGGNGEEGEGWMGNGAAWGGEGAEGPPRAPCAACARQPLGGLVHGRATSRATRARSSRRRGVCSTRPTPTAGRRRLRAVPCRGARN